MTLLFSSKFCVCRLAGYACFPAYILKTMPNPQRNRLTPTSSFLPFEDKACSSCIYIDAGIFLQ